MTDKTQEQAPILSAELAELRKLAEAATPGPWECREADGMAAVLTPEGWMEDQGYEQELWNTRFIAAANPAVTLRLLDALDHAHAALYAGVADRAAAPAVPAQEQSELPPGDALKLERYGAEAMIRMKNTTIKAYKNVVDEQNGIIASLREARTAQEQAASCPDYAALLEFYKAAMNYVATTGHPDATAEDERKAEARYDAAMANVARHLAAPAQNGGAAHQEGAV